jgi:hypothetical protein
MGNGRGVKARIYSPSFKFLENMKIEQKRKYTYISIPKIKIIFKENLFFSFE